ASLSIPADELERQRVQWTETDLPELRCASGTERRRWIVAPVQPRSASCIPWQVAATQRRLLPLSAFDSPPWRGNAELMHGMRRANLCAGYSVREDEPSRLRASEPACLRREKEAGGWRHYKEDIRGKTRPSAHQAFRLEFVRGTCTQRCL